MTVQANLKGDREMVLSRLFDAPRDLVWKMWTQPEHLANWWGPHGFTITTHKHELKQGGVWNYVMHGPDGRDYENRMTILELVPPERLTYKHGGEEPVNHQMTITFEETAPGKTRVTMNFLFQSKDARDFVIREYGALEGGKQTLGRLAEYLNEQLQTPPEGATTRGKPFVITRVLNIPLERVWAAWTERDELQKWFGPQGVSMPHCTLDLRPGGRFHYCLRGPDGKDMWGKWTFRQIGKPERLECLVSFADEKGETIRAFFDPNWPLETRSLVTFAHHAGIGHGTAIRIEWTALNATDAEQKAFDAGHDGMRQGWTGTLDRLAAHLAQA